MNLTDAQLMEDLISDYDYLNMNNSNNLKLGNNVSSLSQPLANNTQEPNRTNRNKSKFDNINLPNI